MIYEVPRRRARKSTPGSLSKKRGLARPGTKRGKINLQTPAGGGGERDAVLLCTPRGVLRLQRKTLKN